MQSVEEMDIRRIVADGDLDGLLSAAILRRVWPEAAVRFSHPAVIRSGGEDAWMGRDTAVLDLPFHPECGLHIDHHLTNRPTPKQAAEAEAAGIKIVWAEALSAARVCFDTFREVVDLSDIETWMPMVDKLDGGRISREEFLSDDPVVWVGRTIDATDPDHCSRLLDRIAEGLTPAEVAAHPCARDHIAVARAAFEGLARMLDDCTTVVDRLAIVRLEEKDMRTNGYLVTAHVGEACDACMIIHGHADGVIGGSGRWPLSASFYTNSFLHAEGGIFDLTRLATSFDVDGGGHANACGCRIQPLDGDGAVVKRPVESADIERNIAAWLGMWAER